MGKLYKFLSKTTFTVLLLLCSALFVIAGTLIESSTGSHAQAAVLTYEHPLFKLLLAGYFINILFSALSRYPFKKRHIPFLLTHIGLLMLILGVFIKVRWGVQGTLAVVEGSGSHTLLIPNTEALVVEQKHPRRQFVIDLERGAATLQGLNIRLIDKAPYSTQEWHSFFQDNQVVVAGFAPIPIFESDKTVSAVRTSDFQEGVQKLLKKSIDLSLWGIPLSGFAIQAPLIDNNRFAPPQVELSNGKKFPLHGPYPEGFDVKVRPRLHFLQDEVGDVAVVLLSQEGHLEAKLFPKNDLGTIVVYDEGFSGYGAQCSLSGYPLECILRRIVTKLPTNSTPCPCITLEVEKGGVKENVELVFDQTGSGLKIPVLQGRYKLGYQPLIKEIPYHVRLSRARQINYPGTNHPLAYEADLKLTNRKSGIEEKITLWMNKTYETKEGWRFYLAGMTPSDESDIKRVHLVVNYDPAKHILTYPGAAFVALGIVLLFFGRFFR